VTCKFSRNLKRLDGTRKNVSESVVIAEGAGHEPDPGAGGGPSAPEPDQVSI
jgi:hypothetical protein